VAELVSLSKKYGILTPYTSFLALEEQQISREADLAPVVTDNLSILQEETVGASANAQRALKAEMKQAAPVASESRSQWSGGAASLAASAPEAVQPRMASLDKRVARAKSQDLRPPRQLAGQTFFHKNSQWQAENLSEEDLKAPVLIKQMSEEYFELARKLSPEEMVWLTQNEPVVFKYDGRSYLIEPVEGEG